MSQKQAKAKRIRFYTVTGIMLILSIFTGIAGVWWLTLGLLLSAGVYTLYLSPFNLTNRFYALPWVYYPSAFGFIFALTVMMRIFFIEIYYIPSDSMSDTLVTGDRIIMEKLSLGPRMPETIYQVPWLGFAARFIPNLRNRTPDDWWGYRRLSGFTKPKHNDILVYNTPDEKRLSFIKRSVGLPGDTLKIRNSEVFINGTPLPFPEKSKHMSRLYYQDYKKTLNLMDNLSVSIQHINYEKKYINATLNKLQEERLLAASYIRSVEIEQASYASVFQKYPHHPRYHWTLDDFGPIVIPEKGLEIELNEDAIIFYSELIKQFESVELTKADSLFAGGDYPASTYVFEQNYYFMLGDYRHNSKDSRYQGLVPESHLVGKASFVLFSHRGDMGISWKRFLYRNFR